MIDKNFLSNLSASVVVFLVALPLCLGIALASGAPLFSGILAGIIGGIVIGSLSGSAVGVSGPAAGLAVIVLNGITDLGWQPFLLAVAIGGAIQVLMGVARLGGLAYFFPSSVIKGMLAAIGILIILKQIPHAFGYDADFEGDESFFQPDGETTFSSIISAVRFFHPGAMLVSFLGLSVYLVFLKINISKSKFSAVLQPSLLVVLLGVLVVEVLQAWFPSIAIKNASHLVAVPVLGSLNELTALISLPDFSAINNSAVWVLGVTIAAVASLETLLSVEAADKLDHERRKTPPSRELIAQGVGNMLGGLIGAIPCTQVIVRSSANVSAGAKSKASAIMHGILLLGSVLLIPAVLNRIPLSALAVVLIYVGLKLNSLKLYRSMLHRGAEEYVPFVVTIAGVAFTNLLVGVGVGLGITLLIILYRTYRVVHTEEINEEKGKKTITISLARPRR